MAVEFMDGWEGGGMELWTNSNVTVIAARTGHSGSYCALFDAVADNCYKAITADDEYYFMLRLEPNDAAAHAILTFLKDAEIIMQVRRVVTTGYLAAYVGTSVVETATTHGLTSGTVYLIEGYIKVADSGGRFVVKVDGITVIDYTGDTKPGADTQVNTVKLGYDGAVQGQTGYYDDFILDHDDYLGNLRIQGIVPSGAGTTTEWDPSAGSNWDCVEERPASDVNYVSTNVANEIDLYAASNLTGTVSNIKAVQLHARGAYEGSPTPTHIQLGIRSGGSNYFSADMSPPASFGLVGHKVWDLDPNGDITWIEANVNVLEIGAKATA